MREKSHTWRHLGSVAVALAVAGCEPGVLQPAGPVGVADRTILIDSLIIMLAIVVPTILAIFGFAWWYRAGNTRARFRPDFTYDGRIELVVWGIPLLVIMLLGGVTWIGAHELDPGQPIEGGGKALEVQVVSMDWKWLFIYPGENVAAVNQLVIPVGVPVHFTLTSASVMNAFFIPRLGSMIYTMNGMATQLNLQADQAGDYRGQSSHFSGDGFSGMDFVVKAVAPAQFTAWVNTVHGGALALDATSYGALGRQSTDVPPATFKSVAADLFRDIVTLKVAPTAGPVVDSAAATASPAPVH